MVESDGRDTTVTSGSFRESTYCTTDHLSSSLICSPEKAGIGVPVSPVANLVYMSSGLLPPLKTPFVKSLTFIGRPQSSTCSWAEGPSPVPSLPWHFTQPN